MNYYYDISSCSINKFGEELCGDKVEIIKTEDNIIIVLSDGLGSGVKANILATLTAKIAATMLREGAKIEETVNTIVNTLPECSIRKLAYSTFTMIKIHKSGSVYIAEYDNPPIFIYRNDYIYPIEKEEININGKKILESHFEIKNGDMLSVVSDGAIHAGVGALLNLGWQWENVNDYLRELNSVEKAAKNITGNFISVCNNLYNNQPGDDTTIVTIKVREPEIVHLFTGPPENKENDQWIINTLKNSEGKKVICGGTAANIAARELKEDLIVDLKSMNKNIPPIAILKGFDLITEGVLTLKATLELLKDYLYYNFKNHSFNLTNDYNGACKLADLLINRCTHLNIYFGKAINPAHQNPDMPINLNIKLKIVNEIIDILKKLGKEVKLIYI